MTARQLILSLTIMALSITVAMAQEVVTPLQSNPFLRNLSGTTSIMKSKGLNDTLSLPFFDDFSGGQALPSDSLWSDNEVYINNTLALNVLSSGVATFDCLGPDGLLYEFASPSVFESDHLTSNPLDLTGSAADNFYFSFFYQPAGIVDSPEANDSLTLQFYSVPDDTWYSVWRANGTAVHNFKPVIIPVSDSRFTHKGFRFRFTSYASLSPSDSDPAMSGDADQWHIDYVYLDRNRNSADTLLHDVAFTSQLRSLLEDYEAMPWSQFLDWTFSAMGSFVEMNYANNDNITRNVTRTYTVRDVYTNTIVHSYTPLAKNLDPGIRENYSAPLIYTFGSPVNDSALFEVTATLVTDIFDIKNNDTIRYLQKFDNYFAVDDGSAEGGYGINGQGADNAIAVYRYRSLSPDTLRAISICFNDSYLNANQRSFDLVVISAINQEPGDVIYTQEEEMVDPGSTRNGFATYRLNDPVAVDGYFFVGWKQRSETFLNAGIDLNTPPQGRQYYYLNGSWNQSQVAGSIMIRPVVGDPLVSTGIGITRPDILSLRLWPNPASHIIHLGDRFNYDFAGSRIDIFNMSGQRVKSLTYSESIDISSLPEGIYLLNVADGRFVKSSGRFIKTR